MMKKLLSTALLLTVMAVSFSACDKKEPVSSQSTVLSEDPIVESTETSVTVSSTASVSTEVSVSESVSEDVSTEQNVEVIAFDVMILNMSTEDVGTVSGIDPVDGSQVNMGGLPAGEVVTLKFTEWPKDADRMSLAFYGMDGVIIVETDVDLTGITKMVTIKLSGEGQIDDLKVQVD